MRLALALLLSLLPSTLLAQRDWLTYKDQGGCIGGNECRERRLRVALADRPVLAVRFHAHDQVGTKADGRLRIKIDGNTVEEGLDIPRKGETFTVDVDRLRGRTLVFEAGDDEVIIADIAVLYARDEDEIFPRRPRRERSSDLGRGGWRTYRSADMCIGGDECRKNGNRVTVALEDAPVIGIRFWAHDQIGTRADGRLSVRIDDTVINSYIDVQRNGKRHELDVDHVRGSRLVISTTNDDEVEISEVEVLYGRGGGRGDGGYQPETTHAGECIGGDDCGGRRARIRVPLREAGVTSIRFYARDDVGTRAGGQLRIRIDDEIVRDSLDIPREGKTFTFDVDGLEGEYLFIEPAADDEVVVRDIRVVYGVR